MSSGRADRLGDLAAETLERALAVQQRARDAGDHRPLGVARELAVSSLDRITVDDLRLKRPGLFVKASRARGRGLKAEMQEVEKEKILRALARDHGNQTAAAADLGISRPTLYRKLRQHGIHVGEHEQ